MLAVDTMATLMVLKYLLVQNATGQLASSMTREGTGLTITKWQASLSKTTDYYNSISLLMHNYGIFTHAYSCTHIHIEDFN